MSDGSAQIRCLDPVTLRELWRVTVHDERAIPMLNELECVDGEIYANFWQTDRIVVSGLPMARSRAGSMYPVCYDADDLREPVDVLNAELLIDAAGSVCLLPGQTLAEVVRGPAGPPLMARLQGRYPLPEK